MKINNIMNIYEQSVSNKKEQKPTGDFSSFLRNSLEKVNELEQDSAEKTNLFAIGKIDNIHEVMIAAQKAEVALQFTLEIKNKIMDAYREIMRLQV